MAAAQMAANRDRICAIQASSKLLDMHTDRAHLFAARAALPQHISVCSTSALAISCAARCSCTQYIYTDDFSACAALYILYAASQHVQLPTTVKKACSATKKSRLRQQQTQHSSSSDIDNTEINASKQASNAQDATPKQ
jgi:hypothetical protein